jgi:hypothetical protein
LIRWPGKRKKNDLAAQIALLQQQIAQWHEQYSRLEEAVDRLQNKFPQVTIEHVHIHQPVLEKLEFRMDGLEIEQLSGSLNLGNNFGAKIHPANETGMAAKRPPFPTGRSDNATGASASALAGLSGVFAAAISKDAPNASAITPPTAPPKTSTAQSCNDSQPPMNAKPMPTDDAQTAMSPSVARDRHNLSGLDHTPTGFRFRPRR